MSGYTRHPEPSPEKQEELVELFAAALEKASAVLIRVPVETWEEEHDLAERLHSWSAARGNVIERIGHCTREFRLAEHQEEHGPPVYHRIDPYLEIRFPATVDLDHLVDLLPIVEPHAWPDRPEIDLVPKGAEA